MQWPTILLHTKKVQRRGYRNSAALFWKTSRKDSVWCTLENGGRQKIGLSLNENNMLELVETVIRNLP